MKKDFNSCKNVYRGSPGTEIPGYIWPVLVILLLLVLIVVGSLLKTTIFGG